MSGPAEDATSVLSRWAAPDPAQETLRQAYVDLLRSDPTSVWRDSGPAHLTASALVLDSTATRVLLTLHRKGGFWAQFGGHCEPGDRTLLGAALREAREESGVAGLRPLRREPVDLDRHELSSAFGRCAEHLDVRYALLAPEGATPVVSGESDDVAWFAVDDLPAGTVDLERLVRRAAALASGRQSQSSESPSSAVADTPSRYPRARSRRG